jgi:hypothetical protein
MEEKAFRIFRLCAYSKIQTGRTKVYSVDPNCIKLARMVATMIVNGDSKDHRAQLIQQLVDTAQVFIISLLQSYSYFL